MSTEKNKKRRVRDPQWSAIEDNVVAELNLLSPQQCAAMHQFIVTELGPDVAVGIRKQLSGVISAADPALLTPPGSALESMAREAFQMHLLVYLNCNDLARLSSCSRICQRRVLHDSTTLHIPIPANLIEKTRVRRMSYTAPDPKVVLMAMNQYFYRMLTSLKRFTNLTILSFGAGVVRKGPCFGTSIPGSETAGLSDIPDIPLEPHHLPAGLESLIMGKCTLSQKDLPLLFTRLSNLRVLDAPAITVHVGLLRSELPNLTYLNIADIGAVRNANFNFSTRTKLAHVGLMHPQSGGWPYDSVVANMESLTSLALPTRSVDLKRAGMPAKLQRLVAQQVLGACVMTTLTELHVLDLKFELMHSLTDLFTGFPNLKSLSVTINNQTDMSTRAPELWETLLQRAPHLRHLRLKTAKDPIINAGGFAAMIAGIGRLPLHSLHFEHCSIGIHFAAEIAGISSLQSLFLTTCTVEPHTHRLVLRQLARLPELHHLDLTSTQGFNAVDLMNEFRGHIPLRRLYGDFSSRKP